MTVERKAAAATIASEAGAASELVALPDAALENVVGGRGIVQAAAENAKIGELKADIAADNMLLKLQHQAF